MFLKPKIYLMIIFDVARVIFAQSRSGDEEEQEMCFPFRRAPSMKTPSCLQGHPGKLGPSGPPGPKGDPGEAGECGCDPNEVEQQNRRIQELQGSFIVWFTCGQTLIFHAFRTFKA